MSLFDTLLLQDLDAYRKSLHQLENHFKIRPLNFNDYSKGYFALLKQLTVVGDDLTEDDFLNKFSRMQNLFNSYFIVVIEDLRSQRIIANATLFIEEKFIRNCSKRGRIEDVVVDSNYRGNKFGQVLLDILVELAKKTHCYKLTLECNKRVLDFYKKAGFANDADELFMFLRF